ncbi:hypothetical protein FB451DRAFT_1478439, partial [Mycena latifolia]
MQQYAKKTHQEVLALISVLSDGGSSDRGSLISGALSSLRNSSNSLSLLPPEPKIFHGRESEVSAIVQMFEQQNPRIAILGPGGMGKTSLARAVLHHPDITHRYEQHRMFVACDAAANSVQLAALIGACIGLKPGHNLTYPVVHYFSSSPASLLILDNLETVWEPRECRGELENFLSLLTAIDHLALIASDFDFHLMPITMRGAERPANVQWTHPFLAPLKPLTQDAARKTFTDITDHEAFEDIDKILVLADNMPLAIDLLANLVDHEGFSSVYDRWEAERTALLSLGYDKGSNLDISIALSLESPRLASLPHSKDLLSLLSILPDGISEAELLQAQLPIDNVLACKAALLRTSLAYADDQQHLKVLVPIREYMHKRHPPTTQIVQPLLKYFQKLLEIFVTFQGTGSGPDIAARIAPNCANIQGILAYELDPDSPGLR